MAETLAPPPIRRITKHCEESTQEGGWPSEEWEPSAPVALRWWSTLSWFVGSRTMTFPGRPPPHAFTAACQQLKAGVFIKEMYSCRSSGPCGVTGKISTDAIRGTTTCEATPADLIRQLMSALTTAGDARAALGRRDAPCPCPLSHTRRSGWTASTAPLGCRRGASLR